MSLKMSKIFIILLFFHSSNITWNILCASVQNRFKYCEGLSNAKHIDLETNCKKEDTVSSQQSGIMENYTKAFDVDFNTHRKNNTKFGLTFLTKITNQVNGIGYQCKMEKVIFTTFQNIFGSKSKDQTTENVVLSPKSCWEMIISGACKDKQMKCDGKSCKYTAKFELSYVWLETRKYEDYNCETHERILTAKNENDPILGNIDGTNSCKSSELFCYKLDYIVVWKQDIIHKCPYEVITLKENSLWNDHRENEFVFAERVGNSSNVGVLSAVNNLYFSLTTVEWVCNTLVVSTNEGIYLTSIHNGKNFRKHAIGLKDISDLALADKDYTTFQDSIEKLKIYESFCYLLMNTIKVFSMHQNEYISLLDRNGKNMVLYATNENIYVPHCIDISEINVHDSTENCYEDVAISFNNNNRTINGFLQNDRIIKRNSKKISCDLITNNFVHIDKNNKIRRQGRDNYLEIVNDDNSIEKVNILDLSIIDPNFHHNQVLIESVDVLDEIHRYSQISDSSLGEFVVSITGHESYKSISSFKRPLDTIGNVTLDVVNYSVKTYYTIKIVAIILVFCLFTFIIIFIIVKICKVCGKHDNNNNSKFRSSNVRYKSKEGKIQLFDV